MALPVNGSTHLIPAYYSFYRPRKDERLNRPSWLTCCGRFTHISGHPSAAGRAQDRESSPVRDRRSTAVPLHQLSRSSSINQHVTPRRCHCRRPRASRYAVPCSGRNVEEDFEVLEACHPLHRRPADRHIRATARISSSLHARMGCHLLPDDPTATVAGSSGTGTGLPLNGQTVLLHR